MSTIIKEFSRFAHQYEQHNMIQVQVAKRVIEKLPKNMYKSILDIGCGSGQVFRNMEEKHIDFTSFTAFDSSSRMLALHPESPKIEKICGDFNSRTFTSYLDKKAYDLVLSSSALQWSSDLDFTISTIASLSNTFHTALFTSNTFKTLHETAGVTSPIYSAEEVQKTIERYYDNVNFELHTYSLQFDSVRDMFRYIKKSGVSSGEKKLSYKETKALMESYPLDHLEFEVLFAETKNLQGA